jgi:hypothetical protein
LHFNYMPQLGLGLGAQINESNSFDPDALRYFTTAGVTNATGRSQINTFVRGIKSLGLYNNMVCWPLRSTQNNSSGTTAYSLGGFGVYNGALNNGPTWGTGGVTFDGVNDYISTGFTGALPEFTIFSIATPTNTVSAGAEIAKDNFTTSREFGLLTPSASTHSFYVFSPTTRTLSNLPYETSIKSICMRASSSVFKYRKNNQTDFSGATGTLTTGSMELTIGAISTGALRFNGTISASILFNTALTDSQTSAVYALYQTSLGAGLGLPDADASAYIARAGVTDTTGQQQINDFVVGVKNLGLYNNMVAWPLRSTQNAGTGGTAYSIGGLGTYDGTLTNGPTWGTGGITFDGVNDSIPTTFTTGLSELTAFSVANSSSTNTNLEFAKDDQGSNREFAIFSQSGNAIRFLVVNSAGLTTPVAGAYTNGVIRASIGRASSSVAKTRLNNGSDVSGTSGVLTQGTAVLTIGARSGSAGAFFPGTMSATILFNKALTDSETSSMYTLYSTTIGSGLGLP